MCVPVSVRAAAVTCCALCCPQTMASMLNRAAFRLARPAVRQSNRRMGTAVESTVPEAALQPKKTYTSGDKKLMDAKYTEDIGYMFGEKVRLPTRSIFLGTQLSQLNVAEKLCTQT